MVGAAVVRCLAERNGSAASRARTGGISGLLRDRTLSCHWLRDDWPGNGFCDYWLGDDDSFGIQELAHSCR